jgi:RNA polymerase sigma-70 factor (ECF subfamily)
MGAAAIAEAADSELIGRYLGGDEAAASELVARHARALARFLSVQGAPDDELEDVTQDAFFKAFRSLKTFRGGSSFRTWLMAIASNVLTDRRRQWKRRTVLELTPEVADPRADPVGQVDALMTEERLRAGLSKLSPSQRDVFLLRVNQGLDYQEIAAALDISEGAARVHYHHALKRLKGLLDG